MTGKSMTSQRKGKEIGTHERERLDMIIKG